MARKLTFTKEQLLEKTKKYITEKGIEKLNARDLCKYIGCSTQPLFKNFYNMEQLKKELKNYLHNHYDNFITKIVDKEDYLYTISYAYALYALKEPNVFKALFMSDLAGTRTIEEVLSSSHNIATIESMPSQYNISILESKKIYRDVRFYTHGLACQIAINSISVTEEEIKKLIKEQIKKLSR